MEGGGGELRLGPWDLILTCVATVRLALFGVHFPLLEAGLVELGGSLMLRSRWLGLWRAGRRQGWRWAGRRPRAVTGWTLGEREAPDLGDGRPGSTYSLAADCSVNFGQVVTCLGYLFSMCVIWRCWFSQ